MKGPQPATRLPRHKRFFNRRGLLYSLLVCVLILVVGGAGFWAIDPKVHNLIDGMWLAFTTATTVGYGDMVPSTNASRFFSVLVVLLGLAVLSMVTAAVAAIFVEVEERQIERDLLHEIGSLRAEVRELRALLLASRGAGAQDASDATATAPAKALGPREDQVAL